MSNRTLHAQKHIELPMPPQKNQIMEMDIYVRFMRHMRAVPNSKKEIKILSAIQYTADMGNHSDAHVAKILVELGLRAPRLAFPAEFLTHIDQAQLRNDTMNRLSASYENLIDYWQSQGEDRFAHIKRDFAWRETSLVRESA